MSRKRILFVCLGNICRSPLAEGILKKKIREKDLKDILEVDSCGTGDYHIGEQPDRRTIENASINGLQLDHKARQLKKRDLDHFDYIFVMDSSNLKNTHLLASEGQKSKIQLIRNYDFQAPGADVPDPYFGGSAGFQEVYDILDRSIEQWLNKNQ